MLQSIAALVGDGHDTTASDGNGLPRMMGAAQLVAESVEDKDSVTSEHLDRTYRYAVSLGRVVDPALVDDPLVRVGWMLHDAGKVAVPDAVLNKPAALTDLEWGLMRAHPVVGAVLLEPFDEHGTAVAVVRHHHERFDGGGYPDGLRGEQIPLAARVFAVADTYDAMTSHRPYRSALRHDQAVEEILRCRGTQFDPQVVDAFVDVADEWALRPRP